eukprot:10674819-Alexandrium_andersonii.AAC.1
MPPSACANRASLTSACENANSVATCFWICTAKARESMPSRNLCLPSNQRNHMRLPNTVLGRPTASRANPGS